MNNATDIERTPASGSPRARLWPFRPAGRSPLPGSRVPPAGLSASLTRRAKRRRQHQALADLDDRLLADIGVTREERARELARYFATIF